MDSPSPPPLHPFRSEPARPPSSLPPCPMRQRGEGFSTYFAISFLWIFYYARLSVCMCARSIAVMAAISQFDFNMHHRAILNSKNDSSQILRRTRIRNRTTVSDRFTFLRSTRERERKRGNVPAFSSFRGGRRYLWILRFTSGQCYTALLDGSACKKPEKHEGRAVKLDERRGRRVKKREALVSRTGSHTVTRHR